MKNNLIARLLMSIGALVDPEQPMIWRAPIVTQALMQIFNDTHWGELDYLDEGTLTAAIRSRTPF